MSFTDRMAAGRQLANEVTARLHAAGRDERPLILGLPRGGMLVAAALSRALRADLDVLVARPITTSWRPAVVIGAVAESGPPVIDYSAGGYFGLDGANVNAAATLGRSQIHRVLDRYRAGRRPLPPDDRPCIVVDDGLTPGVVILAALRAVRAQRPDYMLFATPVCAAELVTALRSEVDAIVAIGQPTKYYPLGQWYDDRYQATEHDVRDALARAGTRETPTRDPWASAP